MCVCRACVCVSLTHVITTCKKHAICAGSGRCWSHDHELPIALLWCACVFRVNQSPPLQRVQQRRAHSSSSWHGMLAWNHHLACSEYGDGVVMVGHPFDFDWAIRARYVETVALYYICACVYMYTLVSAGSLCGQTSDPDERRVLPDQAQTRRRVRAFNPMYLALAAAFNWHIDEPAATHIVHRHNLWSSLYLHTRCQVCLCKYSPKGVLSV